MTYTIDLPIYLRAAKEGGVLLEVYVQPGAKKTEWVGIYGDRLKIRLAAPPIEGRANKALCVWVAHELGVAPSSVAVGKGLTGRMKTLHISALTPHRVAELVNSRGVS